MTCGQALGAAGEMKQECHPWDKRSSGTTTGVAVGIGGANVTQPLVISGRAAGSKRAAAFNFDFGADCSAVNREAEAAKLVGPGIYSDTTNASGGAAVGSFGRKTGDAIIFENVAASHELNVLYNNGTGSGKQCSLYAGDKKVGTLKFADTAGWYVPFLQAHYEGELSGTIKLQMDAEDLAANGGDFCCNVDRVVFGPVKPRPAMEARLELEHLVVRPGMAYLSVGLRAPKGLAFSLGVEDSASVRHWSHGVVVQRGDTWEAIAIPFVDFEPKLEPGPIQCLLIRAASDWTGLKGTLAVNVLKFDACWPSDPPGNCPFRRSDTIAGVAFTGRHAEYTGADTWYPTWASDGNQYSPFTDGQVNGVLSVSDGTVPGRKSATTGYATIIGEDPLKLQVVNPGTVDGNPAPYQGRYPCGSLVYNGIWFYGTYCLGPSSSIERDGIKYNWPWLGPFVGFRYSSDQGKSWTPTPCTPEMPLFGESSMKGEPVKIGAPHFVDFGKNLEHSPDGKAYLVAHGASNGANRRFAFNSWITGDEVYLARVTPSIEHMNDASKYEFYAGRDWKGKAKWVNDLGRIKPVAGWRDNMGCVTMTYNAPLKRYLMCVTDGGNTVHYFNTYILESDRATGPWKLVSYLRRFGEQAYFVNIPSKFISADGQTVWLCYAANFSSGWGGLNLQARPVGSRYGMCLQEIKLVYHSKK